MTKNQSSRMGRRRWKGQALIEFALTLPVMIGVFMMCYDLGKMAVVKHKLQQAAYEGIKITSTTMVNIYHVPCDGEDAGDPSNNLCAAVKQRAAEALRVNGIDTTVPGFKMDFTLYTDPADVDDAYAATGAMVTFLVKLEITYPYTYIMGKLLAFNTVNLKVEASTRYVSAIPHGADRARRALMEALPVRSCDEVYSGPRDHGRRVTDRNSGARYFTWKGKRYKPICA